MAPKTTILIIDDDAHFREMTAMVLDEVGHTILEAATGEEGLQLAQQHLPDMVICDVRMGEMDGYATLKALREDERTATIPFVLMTGLADKTHMREGMNLGADDFLVKPFSIDELLAVVNVRLEKHQILTQKAEKKVEALRATMTQTLPHELHTPLTGILSTSQMMMVDAQTMKPAEVKEMATLIHTSGLRLQRLIENSLIYAQVEVIANDEEQQALLKQAVTMDPHDLIRQLAVVEAELNGRTTDLMLLLENAPIAIADHFLTKIVREVIGNAFKFSNPGTPVLVGMNENAWGLEINVTDCGHGMTEAQIDDVGAYMQFERAFREQQGAGLGLQIVKRLIELHDGDLKIQSTMGEGTTVMIRIPKWYYAHDPGGAQLSGEPTLLPRN